MSNFYITRLYNDQSTSLRKEFINKRTAFWPFNEQIQCDKKVDVDVNVKKGTTTLTIEMEGDQNTHKIRGYASFRTPQGRALKIKLDSRAAQKGSDNIVRNKNGESLDFENISNMPLKNGAVRAKSTRYMSRITFSTPEYKGLKYENVTGNFKSSGVCEQLIGDKITPQVEWSTLTVSDHSGWVRPREVQLRNEK